MKKEKRHVFSLLIRFTLGFFAITAISAIFIVGLGALFIELGWIRFPSPLAIVCIAFLASAILGTIATLLVGRRFLSAYEPIEKALAKIGKGDFSIHLDESMGSEIVRKTSHDINIAAYHLRQVEIMRKDFVADFSHEFKTPIVSVQGFAKRLLDKDLSDEKRNEYALIIYEEAKRLALLAENTLLMNRLDSLSVFPDAGQFLLDESIRKVVILLEKQWEAKKLDLNIDLVSMPFYGSQTMMKEVWINLLSNAIKFADVKSTLTLTSNITSQNYEIAIRDHGPIIPTDDLPRVFDKFFQGNEASHMGGNGLGLSIAKRIVELSKGTIGVTSSETDGTLFVVTLPKL